MSLVCIGSGALLGVSGCADSVQDDSSIPYNGVNSGYNPYAVDRKGDYADAMGFGKPDAGGAVTPNPEPDPEPAGIPEANGCPDQGNIQDLAECCDLGAARCLPMDFVPDGLQALVSTCDNGGACVPENILVSMQDTGGYAPKKCQSLIGEGRCISLCVPSVAEYKDILPQDVCAASERCAPCISPLDNKETGACSGDIDCSQVNADPNPAPPADTPDDAAAQGGCDNPPDIDPNTFEPCPCAGTRCVPMALTTPEQKKLLAPCNGGQGVCVPDKMVATAGYFAPKTCTSVGGTEGRCLSSCIPQIAEQAGKLPSAGCDPGELCSPCCDPFTGEDTGACSQGCDVGPAGICAPAFPACCDNGEGHCIDKTLIPDSQQSKLEKCEDKNQMCVPDLMQDDQWKGSPCSGYMWITGENYQGVCLPDCLKLPKLFLDASGCPKSFICTPCVDPLTGGPTDAPGC